MVERIYLESDCLIFPSKLETWGLPLSEYRHYEKPIIAADLGYAKEVLSGYHSAYLFNPDDTDDLMNALRRFLKNSKSDKIVVQNSNYPEIVGWDAFSKWIISIS